MEDQNNGSSQDEITAGAIEEDFEQTRPSIAAYGLEDLCSSTSLEDFDFEEDETSVAIRKAKSDEWFQVHPDAAQRLTAFFIEVESGLSKVNYLLTSGIAKRIMHSDLSDDIKRKYLVPCINLDGGMFLWSMALPLRAGSEVNRFTKRYISFLPELEQYWCRVIWPKNASGDEAIHRLKKAKDFDQVPAWPEPISALDMLKAAATDYLIDAWSHPVLKRLRGEG